MMSVEIIENLIPEELCDTLIEKSKTLLKSEHMVMKNDNPNKAPEVKKNTGDLKFKYLQQEGLSRDFQEGYNPEDYINLVRPNYEEYQGHFDPVAITMADLESVPNDNIWIDKVIGHCLKLVTDKMSDFYSVSIVPDQGGLVKMKTGAYNGLHYDQRNPFTEESRKELPPESQPKLSEYSFLIYLNSCDEDYSGGELYFPNYDLLIKPKKGMAVFFIGDPEHEHEVLTVKSGNRYSLLGFASEDGKPFQI